MTLYSLRDVIFVYFGGGALFLIFSFFQFSEYIDDYTIIMISTLSIIFSLESIRVKSVNSMKINFTDVNFKILNVLLIITISIFIIASGPRASENFQYNYWDFFRAVFISPFFEELMFRVILLGFFVGLVKNFWLSALIVSAAFAFAHNSDIFIYSFLMSLVFCLIRLSTKSVLPCFSLHVFHNLAIFFFDGDLI
ncbi:CPBP family intramembrane metalloprotease [Rheinheimera sp. D18]|uniref:CPBP family intramembrane glutamic endopeptidase n=1 Tax=Rheinheimera sp. D18 TaxID=2545632 RepID=UPI00104C7E65|nr:CPBP family intramembrane glutamic endopeptidase [Rheinheimera sp. D18]QBL10381.1 CPBP family intramembrane metalloprotease [Rheinheimera sp. D18]